MRIEDNLRPPMPADPYPRDVLSVLLLLCLASVLIPSWDMARDTLVSMVAAHMASGLLLMSLGFLLALRCGAIDLSVWVAAGVGGLVAAGLINAGVGVWPAFAIAAGAGLGIGLVNGAMVSLLGLPSPLVTAVVGAVLIWILDPMFHVRQLTVPEQTFSIVIENSSDALVFGALKLRVLAVSAVYVVALLVLVGVDVAVWHKWPIRRRTSLMSAMAASGVLAALGGAMMLIDNGIAPVPTRLVDDLRVPAAALLAGGLFLGRRGRELLAGLSLPSALLICTIWRQKVWILPSPGLGLAIQMFLMMGMVLGVHAAFGRWLAARDTGRAQLPSVAVLLSLGGIALVALAANFGFGLSHKICTYSGIGLWLIAMPAVYVALRRERRLASSPHLEEDSPTVGQYGPDDAD